jgi:NADH dehydrogenase
MEGCDAAIHLVGRIVEKRKASFYQVHYLGAVNVIEAARAAGVNRFLLMSALGVRSEAASLYHRTKWMAEKYLRSSDLDYTIMRPSVIFGADDAFINMLVRMTKFLPIVPVMGPGNGELQPIWREDVAACFVRALSTPEAVGKIYELGGPKQYTFNELLETVASLVGRKSRRLHVPLSLARPVAALMETILPNPPLTRDQLTMLEEPNVCDISLMVNELGVKPAALERVFSSYRGS